MYVHSLTHLTVSVLIENLFLREVTNSSETTPDLIFSMHDMWKPESSSARTQRMDCTVK